MFGEYNNSVNNSEVPWPIHMSPLNSQSSWNIAYLQHIKIFNVGFWEE